MPASRPHSVGMIAMLFWLLAGLAAIAATMLRHGVPAPAWLTLGVIALGAAVCGWGLWQLRHWARWAAVGFLVAVAAGAVALPTLVERRLLYVACYLIVASLCIAFYLLHPSVAAAFRAPRRPSSPSARSSRS